MDKEDPTIRFSQEEIQALCRDEHAASNIDKKRTVRVFTLPVPLEWESPPDNTRRKALLHLLWVAPVVGVLSFFVSNHLNRKVEIPDLPLPHLAAVLPAKVILPPDLPPVDPPTVKPPVVIQKPKPKPPHPRAWIH